MDNLDKKRNKSKIAPPSKPAFLKQKGEFLQTNTRPLNQLVRLLSNNGIAYTYYRSSRMIVIDHGFKTRIKKEIEFDYWTCERLDFHSKTAITVSFQANNQYLLLIKLLHYNLIPLHIANLINRPKKEQKVKVV